MGADKKIQILVVEDNDKIRHLIVSVLRTTGFSNISEAENGKNAWEMFQSSKYDLVLTDWMMPEMDGLELLKKIRGGEADSKDTPVFLITASDKPDDIVQAAKWKINGYIVKPFSVKTILAKIDAVFK